MQAMQKGSASRGAFAGRLLVLGLLSAPILSTDAAAQFAFVDGQRQTTTGSPSSLAVADFDGDGFPDVASTSASAYLNVMPGDGQGNLLPVRRRSLASASALAAGDFNEDGRPDVAVVLRSASAFSVLLGDGALGFGVPATRFMDLTPLDVRTVDLDRDGNLDLVIIGGTDVRLFFGDGAGAFPFESRPSLAATGIVSTFDVGDVNGDGWLDVVCVARASAAGSTSEVRIVPGNGSRGMGAPYLARIVPVTPTDSLLADFDADGALDLLVSSFPAAPAQLMRGGGDGTFESPSPRFDANVNDMVAADFDFDGFLDVAAGGALSGNLRIFRGDGSLSFAMGVRVGGNVGPLRITAADLDVDGGVDLVTANASDVAPFVNRTVAPCIAGTVNRGRGAVENVLYVNDSTGGASRTVTLFSFQPISIFIAAPSASAGTALFALYAWAGAPQPGDERAMPYGVGIACRPMLPVHGAPQPGAVWNNTGKSSLGIPTHPSSPAPSLVLSRPNGLGRTLRFFLQGVVADPGSKGTRPASVTHGILVQVN
jgi:hypothetical protein